MTNLIAAVFQAIANVFGWSLQRSSVKNQSDIKERKERQLEVDAKTEFDVALKNRDLDRIRKDLAE